MASPLEIGIAFHYHCLTTDFDVSGSPAGRDAIDAFLIRGLLRLAPDGVDDFGRRYQPTEGLALFVT